jgi:AcrR family transcriptional regulator
VAGERRRYGGCMSLDAVPPSVEGRPGAGDVRDRIAAAARELFASQGYESTTVEAVAERAGVSRRTFFRHFRSKDDAIFPDHERIRAAADAHLAALTDVPPVRAVCSGVRVVFRSYVDDPAVSVQRYHLARTVPALKDREIAGVSGYTHLFSRYLRDRLGPAEGARLYADVVAAAVVAAHNEVLRAWLLAGGEGDPLPQLDAALAWVTDRFENALPDGDGGGTGDGGGGGDTVIAVFRSGEPLDAVIERISRSI